MVSQFRSGFLEGISEKLAGPADLKGDYDLMLLASSWDARSTCITSADQLTASRALLLLFDTKDSFGLREDHDAKLEAFCRSHSRNFVPISGASTNVEAIWSAVSREVDEVVTEAKRPIRVFLDLSTCPRYYAAALVGRCFRGGAARSVTAFYAEGHYPDEPEVTFTQGKWRVVAVSGLDGRYDPRNRRYYFIAVGWEGWRTLRTVSRADPDRISILFPDPGFEPRYLAEAEQRNAELISTYHVPSEHVIRAAAGDAIAAWKAISEASFERVEEENVSYLMTGTKPHGLALTLRAIVLEFPALLYVIPEEHNVLRTTPNGVYWKYEIRDVTALPVEEEII